MSRYFCTFYCLTVKSLLRYFDSEKEKFECLTIFHKKRNYHFLFANLNLFEATTLNFSQNLQLFHTYESKFLNTIFQ